MSLQEKVLKLRMDAVIAARHAAFWQKAIDMHGETKATAFYTHLGLNHIEKKSVNFDGLTLRREPRETEKIAVKGVSQAQESSKEKIGTILLKLREDLISDGLKGIKKLPVAQYHELTLSASPEIRESLRDRLIKTHKRGRQLVGQELERQQGKAWQAEGSWQHPVDFDVAHKRNGFGPHDSKCIGYECECDIEHEPKCALKNGFPTCSCEFKQFDEEEFDELDTLTDLTDARVANDVQSRVSAAAARFALLGLVGAALIAAIQKEMADGSLGYIDRASTGLANRVINIGREDEAQSRKSEWERIEYSAILDVNCCEVCFSADGQESADGSDLDPAPNPECFGTDLCRCFWVFIAEGNM